MNKALADLARHVLTGARPTRSIVILEGRTYMAIRARRTGATGCIFGIKWEVDGKRIAAAKLPA